MKLTKYIAAVGLAIGTFPSITFAQEDMTGCVSVVDFFITGERIYAGKWERTLNYRVRNTCNTCINFYLAYYEDGEFKGWITNTPGPGDAAFIGPNREITIIHMQRGTPYQSHVEMDRATAC